MSDLAHHQTEEVQLIFLGTCKSDIILIIVIFQPLYVIEHVHQFNFLRLHLNSRLTWNTHIEEISKKISRTIGV